MFKSINRMKYRGPTLGLTTICALLMVSCATPIKVVTNYDSSVDVSQYRTYAWATDTAQIAQRGSKVSVTPFNVSRIETAIEGELAAKGYRRVEPDESPCFAVSFTVRVTESGPIPSRPTHRGVSYGHWPVYGPPVESSQEVHLVSIEIFDGTTRQPVWHGAVGRVTGDVESTIAEEAYAIIGKFPPAA